MCYGIRIWHLGEIGNSSMDNQQQPFELLSNTRVLITGHTGFKGTWLARLLNMFGAQISGVAFPPEPGSLFQRIASPLVQDQKYFDIADSKQLSEFVLAVRPDIVFHLAAQSLVRKSYRDPLATFQTNVMGTVNLLDAVLKSPSIKGVVVATTDKVYKNVEKMEIGRAHV